MKKNCIIIPIYKNFIKLSKEERKSLDQLYTILGEHTIYLIGPSNINWDVYLNNAVKRNIQPVVKEFENAYFADIKGYNVLLISSFFFNAFTKFNYILLYQLDAYVFDDELTKWCSKGYDYIGAPWSGMHVYENEFLDGVGNGGFSLRNVNGALKMLRKLRMLEVLERYQYFNWKEIIPRLPYILFELLKAPKSQGEFEKTYNFQEDVFWCKSASNRLNKFTCKASILRLLGRLLIKNDFKIAPVDVALQFSMETNPKELYKLNKGQLPFGCHAWEKYDPEFWKAFIPLS